MGLYRRPRRLGYRSYPYSGVSNWDTFTKQEKYVIGMIIMGFCTLGIPWIVLLVQYSFKKPQ